MTSSRIWTHLLIDDNDFTLSLRFSFTSAKFSPNIWPIANEPHSRASSQFVPPSPIMPLDSQINCVVWWLYGEWKFSQDTNYFIYFILFIYFTNFFILFILILSIIVFILFTLLTVFVLFYWFILFVYFSYLFSLFSINFNNFFIFNDFKWFSLYDINEYCFCK